jgi:futalosine hydrolase
MGSEKRLLALVAALPSEGELLLSEIRIADTITCGDLEIFRGTLADREVVLAFSGLGKTNASATVASLLTTCTVSRLWMWGSAGAYPHSNAKLTGLALADEEILGDEGVATLSSWQSLEAIGIPLAETNRGPIFNRIPVDPTELERAKLLISQWQTTSLIPSVHLGPFVTVSSVSGNRARAQLLGERFGALCENMEGGAAAQVCYRYGVPFLEIRGLSNWAGDRNKQRWHLAEALSNCQQAILYLLRNWEKE